MSSDLQLQIDQARMQVHTDSYPMSIGELVNLYDDGEIDIHPEFQRIYRWTEEQKSKLIESILLGIPLPSIFVAQRNDGIWDVVDGLQRISTILSFMGKLKNPEGEILPQLTLQATKYLPALAGKVWEDDCNPSKQIDMDIKRVFKREKLDIKIIKRESEGDTKFELFQRLNTGGSKLSDQEVRNCMLLMLNSKGYSWLKEISQTEDFIKSTPLSEKQIEECYNQELALRFIIQRHTSKKIQKEHTDVAPYLNAEMSRLFAPKSEIDFENEKTVFLKTFSLINQTLEDKSFKKFNHEKQKYEGAISLPVYEAITYGISKLIESEQKDDAEIGQLILDKSKELTQHNTFESTLQNRARPIDRMIAMINLGEEIFQ